MMRSIGISAPLIPSPRLVNTETYLVQKILQRQPVFSRRQSSLRPRWNLRSSEIEPAQTISVEETEETDLDPTFIRVLSRDSLPKGVRREAQVDGKSVVVFWYRNEIFACETRSPAEGAFSTGFLDAQFTTEYGIICPGTSTVFSVKTGEILEWYPNNFVLRTLIPQTTCRPLEVYPVKVTKDAIYVSFEKGSQGGIRSMSSKGGSNTSLEDNNVFGLEPQVYADVPGGTSSLKGSSASKLQNINPATIFIATIAVGIVSVAGTAAAIYYESIPGLIIFWIAIFGGVAFTVSKVLGIFDDDETTT